MSFIFNGTRKIYNYKKNKLHDIYKNNDMYVLGNKYKTDKIYRHGYHRFYPKYIECYKNINGAMLEIGVENKFSINLWLDYFPKAFIYGIDINFEDNGKRFKIFKADQSSITELENVKNIISKQLFFIIDDGSHIPEHQLLTFNYFFDSLLALGGTYIIEDIETSYWTKNSLYTYPTNYGYHHPKSIIELFKFLIDDLNTEYLHNENRALQMKILNKYFKESVRNWISSITFAQNCIIIVKKTQHEYNLYSNRNYRYARNL